MEKQENRAEDDFTRWPELTQLQSIANGQFGILGFAIPAKHHGVGVFGERIFRGWSRLPFGKSPWPDPLGPGVLVRCRGYGKPRSNWAHLYQTSTIPPSWINIKNTKG